MTYQHWTDEQVADIPTPRKTAKIYRLTDDGLQVKVQKTGTRSFGYSATNEASGNYQFYPFGQHGHGSDRKPGTLTFAEAYQKLLERKLGAIKQRSGPQPPRVFIDPNTTFTQLHADFIANDINTREMTDEHKRRYERTLETYFIRQPIAGGTGKWGDLRVADFASGDYAAAYVATLMNVQARAAKGGMRLGKCTLAKETDTFARVMFEYACLKKLMTVESIPAKITKLNKPRSIARYLALAEIEGLLRATSVEQIAKNDALRATLGTDKASREQAEKLLDTMGAVFLRLTLATGLRIDSMRLARRSMLDKHSRGMWTIKHSDLKETSAQKEAPTNHYIPITPFIVREINRLDEISGEHDYLFTERWISDPDKVEPRSVSWASHLVAHHAEALDVESDDPWRAHALRRTMNNWMQELGVPHEVIHKASARMPQGLAKTYLVSEMRDHVVDAFEKFHDLVEACELGKGEDWMADIREERLAARRQENKARRQRVGIDR